MNADVLVRFLDKGLINVGGDDGKFGKLEEVARELAIFFAENRLDTLSFILAAVDPEVGRDDLAMLKVADLLKSHWPTYINTFAGTPVLIFRAIILHSLVAAAASDVSLAVATVCIARNQLPLMPLGEERYVWDDVILELEKEVDDAAESEWATPDRIEVEPLFLPKLAPTKLSVKAGDVDADALETLLAGAAGPQTNAGPTNGNPYWQSNNPAAWSSEFAKRAAAAILAAVKQGAATASDFDIVKPLSQVAAAVSAQVDSALSAVSNATIGLQRRTRLLWWKEAMFSPTIRLSYRDFSTETAAALMALDLSKELPQLSPASVPAFLGEAVRKLDIHDHKQTTGIRNLVENFINDTRIKSVAIAALSAVTSLEGRMPLVALMGQLRPIVPSDNQDFRRLTGMPYDVELTVVDWAAWLFRELQAIKALSGPAVARGVQVQD